MVCIPEDELEAIITEEITKAVEEAVRIAVAEERGKRVEAEVNYANVLIDLDRQKRSTKTAWWVAGSVSTVLVTWFVFTLVDALTPELILP